MIVTLVRRSMPRVGLAIVVHCVLLGGPAVLAVGFEGLASPPVLVFMVLVTGWLGAESTLVECDGRGRVMDDAPSGLTGASAIAILMTFWISLRNPIVSPAVAWTTFGVVVMTIGVMLRCLAIRALGRFFLSQVTVMPGQPLLTHGIYAWIRHPSELGNILVAIGGASVLGSGVGVVFGVLTVGAAAGYRVRVEDRMLLRHHPETFVRYAGAVGAFSPFRIRDGGRDAHPGEADEDSIHGAGRGPDGWSRL